ncbi:Adaptor protein complex AP-3 delta subunit [Ascodesmis nigricans]|uniref:AP-3 complex subunit delta n=1 Tax=Ascodesmis nigricans TaxID=341454 RepID=A0A4S2N696_9PEZI|nr:Adaptor protein complex AP-3 delta subunit [Ascodesmis nigricans]
MFEKSLYDLIRGIRSHKGNERQYVLDSLKECRNEAKSQDLDIKATAILKLIYLDMFGHDMSWASFHTLEVMSAPKFRQKRIGYLAAVQSFRIDTDVLMLTTNLMKKDLTSGSVPEMSLAINGLAHIASPSLARDLSPDLVSKLSHSSPNIRKKAVLVLYKCFLQSPELLRTCWPKLRECLNDEDPSVVSATVNVVCELARRNPKNYLPLAPQLFKLLLEQGNNWMTIKLIKLFATLTPLEPRLIKKLIPPITNLIRTTTAMSLLYECINGLIEGGLLAGISNSVDAEELASVCVMKLRGFLVEGDSNLKYVGLVALTKLVATHPHLVNQHQDVILECIDDTDISIRYRALELAVGMVDVDSLPGVVTKLMRQLKPSKNGDQEYVELEGAEEDEDEDDMEDDVIHPSRSTRGKVVALELPDDYKRSVIEGILEMCRRDMYANIADFEWYLDVLVQLVRFVPPVQRSEEEDEEIVQAGKDVSDDIGFELRNVAVRVRIVRPEAVRCAELLLSRRDGIFPSAGGGGLRVLGPAAWIAGEYASLLPNPHATFDYLLSPLSTTLPPAILSIYIQAASKIYSSLTSSLKIPWDPARKSTLTLLTDRLITFLTPLASSPHLEVQERAVEFLELFRLGLEAIQGQPASTDKETYDPPLLLTQAVPSLFIGQELNPVAPGAQRKVPLPPGLDLGDFINPDLASLLASADHDPALTEAYDPEDSKFAKFYFEKAKPLISATGFGYRSSLVPASQKIDSAAAGSYQSSPGPDVDQDPEAVARKRRERRERNRDDPFYIFTPGDVSDGEIDAIPIMELKLDEGEIPPNLAAAKNKVKRKPKERVEIAADEGIDGDEDGNGNGDDVAPAAVKGRKKKGLLQVDSTALEGFSLDDTEEKERDRKEVERSRREVERLRREMEAAAKRVQEQKEVESGAVGQEKVKKGKKKKVEAEGDGDKKVKKKKKVKEGEQTEGGEKPKKKKKKKKKVKSAEEESEEVEKVVE